MSKLCEELELKFSSFEAKIEGKIKNLNELYKDEIELLNQKFNLTNLSEKYSNELNIYRSNLLNQVSSSMRSEINNANEILGNNNIKTAKFKCSRFKPNETCIRRIVNSEFKFGKKFSLSELVKYKYLLEISEFLDISPDEKKTQMRLDKAFEKGRLEIVKYFGENGADVALWSSDELFSASAKGDFQMVKFLVDNGAEVNSKHKYGFTTLLLASENGHLEIVKYLVENGAKVNERDKYWKKPLLVVSKQGHLEIAKYLVENGADVNASDFRNDTALKLACENGHFEIAKYLVEKGANVTEKLNNLDTYEDLED